MSEDPEFRPGTTVFGAPRLVDSPTFSAPAPSVDDRPPRPLSFLRELIDEPPARRSDYALWPPSIPTPTLDAARRKEFDRSQLEGMIRRADGDFRELHAKIAQEAARVRALLPAAPPGWEWEPTILPEAHGTAALGEVSVKIVYRLREVTT